MLRKIKNYSNFDIIISMKEDKCPRCTYPLLKDKKILVCKNCELFIHEGDIFASNLLGRAVYLGKIQDTN